MSGMEHGTILELKKRIAVLDIPLEIPDFKTFAGVYKDDKFSTFPQLGMVVKDRRFPKTRTYVQTFGCSFCAEDKREWLAQVLISQMIELLRQSHAATMADIKEARDAYHMLIGIPCKK